ncbi:MAG TPA: hypothetical protein VN457_05315, partial [Chlamydiales bacterium]|nr:hypothetical protein [Chlamydiales bacterium]
SAPLAKKICCSYCTALTSLSAPLAKKVDCSGCIALSSLSAPLAKEVNYFGCTALLAPFSTSGRTGLSSEMQIT